MRQLRLLAVAILMAVIASGCVWIERVSKDSEGNDVTVEVWVLDVSTDGRYVLIRTAAPLVSSDTNGVDDLYRRDTNTNTTVLASFPFGGGNINAAVLGDAEMSDDGTRFVWASDATNVVSGDTNNTTDVFLSDLSSGKTFRVSVDSAGAQSNGSSVDPAVSADGNSIAFTSHATNLVAGDTNNAIDIFVHDLAAQTTTRVSLSSTGQQISGSALNPTINANGTVVAWESAAANVVPGDTNGVTDVFRSLGGVSERVSVSSTGAQGDAISRDASISENGTVVAFSTRATTFFPSDPDGTDEDIAVRDTVLGTTVNASPGSAQWFRPGINADGTKVASMNSTDFQVHDLLTGLSTNVLTQAFATTPMEGPRLSADGNYVALQTKEQVQSSDTDSVEDVYIFHWREPTVSSVAPSSVLAGATTSVTITGSNFRTGDLPFPFPAGFSWTNVVVVSDTTITADLTVPAAATTGPTWVTVKAPDGGPGFLSGSAGLCLCITVL